MPGKDSIRAAGGTNLGLPRRPKAPELSGRSGGWGEPGRQVGCMVQRDFALGQNQSIIPLLEMLRGFCLAAQSGGRPNGTHMWEPRMDPLWCLLCTPEMRTS